MDYLARRLIDSGWDVQAVQREIVRSETYQQSTQHPLQSSAIEIDAGNRLLWRQTVRRLDAEQYRDSLLVATGRLIKTVGGPSVSGTPARRSLYLRRMRNSSDEMLSTLDAPPGIVGTAKRDVTTTAPQSLMMMNNPRIMNVAKQVAARVRKETGPTRPADRGEAFIRRAHHILTAVDPEPQTVAWLKPLVDRGEQGEVDACHVLLNSNAFLFID